MSLKELEEKSIYIIKEAMAQLKNPAMLWSIGKDSTVLLWLARKAGMGEVRFPVVHIDTHKKFKEIYEFRDKYVKEWGLDLRIATIKNPVHGPENNNTLNCCTERKTQALKNLLKEEKFDGLFVGIRRDEHGIRAKERYFSPRDKEFHWKVAREKIGGDSGLEALQDTEMSGWGLFDIDFGKDTNHVRIHPLLHWSEQDIWKYIRQENIPMVSLYSSKNGKRYRSIGCECCCEPVVSDAVSLDEIVDELGVTKELERSGRAQDKESSNIFEQLRSLGYC